MRPPKKIYLELNNVPPCNFGALWYEEPIEGGVAYVLESDFKERIAYLENCERQLEMIRTLWRALEENLKDGRTRRAVTLQKEEWWK